MRPLGVILLFAALVPCAGCVSPEVLRREAYHAHAFATAAASRYPEDPDVLRTVTATAAVASYVGAPREPIEVEHFEEDTARIRARAQAHAKLADAAKEVGGSVVEVAGVVLSGLLGGLGLFLVGPKITAGAARAAGYVRAWATKRGVPPKVVDGVERAIVTGLEKEKTS